MNIEIDFHTSAKIDWQPPKSKFGKGSWVEEVGLRESFISHIIWSFCQNYRQVSAMPGILEPRNAFLINKPAESDLHGARSHLEDYCSKTMWGVRREELRKLVVISHRPQLLFKNYSVQVLLSFLVLPYVIAKKTRIGLWSRKGSYGLMLTAVSSGNPLNARPCLGEGGGKYNYILRTAFGKIKKWFSEKHTEFISTGSPEYHGMGSPPLGQRWRVHRLLSLTHPWK